MITPSHCETTQISSTTTSTRVHTTKVLDLQNTYRIPRQVQFSGVPSLLTMSEAKAPKVLWKEDVERAMDGLMCELLYVPIQDDKAEDFTKAITVKLPNGTKTIILEICHSANKELFLIWSTRVRTNIGDLGLFGDARTLTKKMKSCQRQINKTWQPESTPEEIAKVDKEKKVKYDELVEKFAKQEAAVEDG